MGWGGHGVRESGLLNSFSKLFAHLILTLAGTFATLEATGLLVRSDKDTSICIPRSSRADRVQQP